MKNGATVISQYSDYAMAWTTRVQFLAGAVTGFFLFTTASRPTLGPTLIE